MVESPPGESRAAWWRRTAAAGARKDRKARPEKIGGLIETMFARLGIAEKVERASVVAEWEDLVGAHIARVARPVRVQGDTLFVEVESASWRMELSMMRPQLMRKLNAGKRRGRIERIVFVQADGRYSEERDGKG
jgi:predicted nucleic acid-binding Zn ribbon protein